MFTLNLGPCSHRAEQLEWVDQPTTTDEDLRSYFNFLDFSNKFLGGTTLLLENLELFSKNWIQGQTITILEWGCGRGDVARSLVEWARRKKVELRVHSVDRHGRFIQMARENSKSYPEITFEVRDLSDPFFLQAQQFDYVVSLGALHRLSKEKSVEALKKFNLLAKRGFIVVDGLRDIRGWLAASVLSRFWSADLVRHDAPLSVRRGFTEAELKKMMKDSALDYAQLQTQLGLKFVLSGERALSFSPQLKPVPGLSF